jgi:hypothetical protein
VQGEIDSKIGSFGGMEVFGGEKKIDIDPACDRGKIG